MVQCVAVYCSVLWSTIVVCNSFFTCVWQCVVQSVVQCVTVCCVLLPSCATGFLREFCSVCCTVWCSVVQCVAVWCSVLQFTGVACHGSSFACVLQYARYRYVLKIGLVLLTTAASVLSAYDLSVWALVIISAAATITSWTEFSDIGRKTERYTQAIVELVNLLSHWKSLSEVEKASIATIKELVQRGEGIISDERMAWVSTANKFVPKGDSLQSD